MNIEEKEVGAFRLVDHHGILVLPFGFNEVRQGAAKFVESPRWQTRTFRLDDPEDAERTGYFLPYIRRFLFPGQGDPQASSERAGCKRYLFDWATVGGSADGLTGTLSGQDNQDNKPFSCALKIVKAELMLFPFEVGFLALDVRLTDPSATYSDQMKALGMLRMLAPWYLGQDLPVWETNGHRFHIPQLVACLMAELSDTSPQLPQSPAKSSLPVKLIHDDRMMVYSFSCLDRSTCPQDIREGEKILRDRAVIGFSQETNKKAENYRDRGLRAWQHIRWEGFAKDGGIQVAFNVDTFEEKYLGLYHRTYYFDVFLLAVLQRVTLLLLYERLSDIPGLTTQGSQSRRIVRRLRHDLLLFKNQCSFSQITLRERGLVLWRKWQETFENNTLLGEVNEQSQELDGYLRSVHQERMERILRLGGFLATTLPFVLGLEVIFGEEQWVKDLKWGLLTTLIVGTGLVAMWILLRKPKMD